MSVGAKASAAYITSIGQGRRVKTPTFGWGSCRYFPAIFDQPAGGDLVGEKGYDKTRQAPGQKTQHGREHEPAPLPSERKRKCTKEKNGPRKSSFDLSRYAVFLKVNVCQLLILPVSEIDSKMILLHSAAALPLPDQAGI